MGETTRALSRVAIGPKRHEGAVGPLLRGATSARPKRAEPRILKSTTKVPTGLDNSETVVYVTGEQYLRRLPVFIERHRRFASLVGVAEGLFKGRGRLGKGVESMYDYDKSRLTVCEHPLIQHKLSILRDVNTDTAQFRAVVAELALFEGFEASRDLPLEDVRVTTPLEETTCQRVACEVPVIVPILRAGLGMAEAMNALFPSCPVGFIGIMRDEQTHEPKVYYCKLPNEIENRICFVVDPMLATGGTLIESIRYLRKAGVKDIRVLTLVSCPEGISAVLASDPDVRIFTCSVDRCLNDDAYILPGLADAGDRIFGTESGK